jgi:type IV secretion system protein VirB10
MSDAETPPLEPTEPPPEPKRDAFRLAAARQPAAKINRKFLVLALGSTGAVLAIFFGARLASAAANQQKIKDPAATAPVTPPPNLKPPSYRDTVIAQAGDGSTSIVMPCSQYPGYANCTADANLPAGTAAAAGANGSPQAAQLAQQQANQLAQEDAAAAQEAYQQARAARSAAVFFPGGATSSGPPSLAVSAPVPPVAFIPATDGGAPPGAENVLSGSGQDEKRSFAGQVRADDYVHARLEAPRSPYEVKAGTIIAAALVTALNSDLPGEIVAQVTQPVYDHVSGRFLLIPQGARLIGQYDSQVAWGQNRALISWNRIVFPNGYSINIGAMEGADPSGASGLTDQVNHHWGTVAAGVLVSAILSAGSAAAQTGAGNGDGGVTVINTGASTATSDASRVGDRIVNKALERQPTIQVRAGFPLRVLVNRDMSLEPYR